MEYKSIQDIAKRINALADLLNSGEITEKELIELETLSRDLYEKSIIINYKAKEEKVFQKDNLTEILSVSEQIKESPVQKSNTKETKKKEGEIQFDFSGGFDFSEKDFSEERMEEIRTEKVEETKEEVKIINEEPKHDKNTNPFFSYFSKSFVEMSSDKINNTKLASLKGAFGLNDKILFINELFKGNGDLFNQTIEKLDDLGDNTQAIHQLSEVALQQNWNTEQQTVNEFTSFVVRRYVE